MATRAVRQTKQYDDEQDSEENMDDFNFEDEEEDEEEDDDDDDRERQAVSRKKRKFDVDEFMGTGRDMPLNNIDGPKILRMNDYFKMIELIRNQFVERKIKYERELYTSVLTPDEDKFLKMYLITVGYINDKEKPKRKKTLTAFVGASRTSTLIRIHEHNLMGAEHKNPRTKNGASLWKLCMILYVPDTLRRHISSQVLHKYWDSAHGKGKINRGIFMSKYLGLPCYIPEELKESVFEQNEKFKSPSYKTYDFKPVNVEVNNSNKSLFL